MIMLMEDISSIYNYFFDLNIILLICSTIGVTPVEYLYVVNSKFSRRIICLKKKNIKNPVIKCNDNKNLVLTACKLFCYNVRKQ